MFNAFGRFSAHDIVSSWAVSIVTSYFLAFSFLFFLSHALHGFVDEINWCKTLHHEHLLASMPPSNNFISHTAVDSRLMMMVCTILATGFGVDGTALAIVYSFMADVDIVEMNESNACTGPGVTNIPIRWKPLLPEWLCNVVIFLWVRREC